MISLSNSARRLRLHFTSVLMVILALSGHAEETTYWLNTADGTKLVYFPVDSVLVMEFAPRVSADEKKEILAKFNLRLLPLPPYPASTHPIRNSLGGFEPPAYQTVNDTILIVSTTHHNRSALRTKLTRQYRATIKWIFPALRQKGSKFMLFVNPTKVGFIFHFDVHCDSAHAVLKRHGLFVSKNWVAQNFDRFYVFREAQVNIPRHTELFEIIHEMKKESEVYCALPVLVNGLSPSVGNQRECYDYTSRQTPLYVKKLNGDLFTLYWMSKTAPDHAVKEFLRKKFSPGHSDSARVYMYLHDMKLWDLYSFMRRNGISHVDSPSIGHDGWFVYARIAWRELGKIVACNEVKSINQIQYFYK